MISFILSYCFSLFKSLILYSGLYTESMNNRASSGEIYFFNSWKALMLLNLTAACLRRKMWTGLPFSAFLKRNCQSLFRIPDCMSILRWTALPFLQQSFWLPRNQEHNTQGRPINPNQYLQNPVHWTLTKLFGYLFLFLSKDSKGHTELDRLTGYFPIDLKTSPWILFWSSHYSGGYPKGIHSFAHGRFFGKAFQVLIFF